MPLTKCVFGNLLDGRIDTEDQPLARNGRLNPGLLAGDVPSLYIDSFGNPSILTLEQILVDKLDACPVS
ncbi:MAG: hypothetical protein N3A02_04305, partial [Rectinema sp.]|nr:hypothetical protein [Rectinema sp.]